MEIIETPGNSPSRLNCSITSISDNERCNKPTTSKSILPWSPSWSIWKEGIHVSEAINSSLFCWMKGQWQERHPLYWFYLLHPLHAGHPGYMCIRQRQHCYCTSFQIMWLLKKSLAISGLNIFSSSVGEVKKLNFWTPYRPSVYLTTLLAFLNTTHSLVCW